jgi:hypothetical protein
MHGTAYYNSKADIHLMEKGYTATDRGYSEGIYSKRGGRTQ